MKRNLAVGGVLIAVVAAALIGWQFGRQVQSPAEAAASAAAPEPSLITVEVELVELATRLIVRGDIVYDEPESLGLSGSLGPTVEAPVVTRVVEEGGTLDEGQLALEVAGRPVLFLQGEIPMYRDLRPGSSGVDVEQLELALARLGYYGGTPDDTWDVQTGAAIESWYGDAGYEAEGATEAQLSEIQGARDRVSSAADAVASATKSLNDAKAGLPESVILAQKSQVATSEEGRVAAEAAAKASSAEQEAFVIAAQQTLVGAEQSLTVAEERLRQTTEDNVHPDTGLAPTPDELATLQSDVTAAEEAVAAATIGVAEAEAVRDAVSDEQASFVRQATDNLAIAQAQLDELLAPPDTTFEKEALDGAKRSRSDAEGALSKLLTDYGTWLPAGQVVFLDFMPVRVDRLAVARGDMVTGSFMTVSGSDLTIASSVPERDSANVFEGLEVVIEDRINDTDIAAVIGRKALRAGTNGVATDRVYIELESSSIPPELVGSNVKITIPLSTTGGEVLAVPAAALSATADESVRVEIDNGDGTTRFVTVEAGLSTGGLVEITPIDGEIVSGDLVVVGVASDG